MNEADFTGIVKRLGLTIHRYLPPGLSFCLVVKNSEGGRVAAVGSLPAAEAIEAISQRALHAVRKGH